MISAKYFTTIILLLCTHPIFSQVDSAFWNKQFVQLSFKGGDTVIFNPCDALNRTLFISQDSIFDNQGQEQVTMKIANAEHNDTAWVLHTPLADYTLVYYNETSGIAKWKIKYKPIKYPVKILFVQKEKSNCFKVINQPCKECWGSDCDDVKKKTD